MLKQATRLVRKFMGSGDQPPEYPKADPELLEWLERAQREVDFTHDSLMLNTLTHQVVFIYDEMMAGFPMHQVLGDQVQHVGTAFTDSVNFRLWKKKAGLASQCIAIRDVDHPESCRIKGELYVIPSGQVKELDRYKMNGLHYKRRRERLNRPYRQMFVRRNVTGSQYYQLSEEMSREVVAWMYIGVPSYWNTLMDDSPRYVFGKVQKYKPNKNPSKPYYFFTRNELK